MKNERSLSEVHEKVSEVLSEVSKFLTKRGKTGADQNIILLTIFIQTLP